MTATPDGKDHDRKPRPAFRRGFRHFGLMLLLLWPLTAMAQLKVTVTPRNGVLPARDPLAAAANAGAEPASVAMLESAILGGVSHASRQGDRLILLRADGSSLALRDRLQCADAAGHDDCVRYRLVAEIPSRKLFLIQMRFRDGVGYRLTGSDTNWSLDLPGVPRFSPSGRSFVLFDNDEARGTPGAIEIWTRAASGARYARAWRHDPTGDPILHLTALKAWRGENDIAMTMVLPTRGGRKPVEWPARAARAGRTWRLTAAWPRAKPCVLSGTC